MGPQLGPPAAQILPGMEVPAPGVRHGRGALAVPGEGGHDHFGGGEHQELRDDAAQVERAIALEDGPQLVTPLQGLQLDGRVGVRPVPRHGRTGPVGQTVDGLDPPHGAPAAGQELQVTDAGGGGDDHPGASDLGPPAQVEVLPHRHDGRVEPTQLGEEVGPHQRAPARRQEDVEDRVVLAVIDLTGLDAVDHRAALVHPHPDMEQSPGVGEVHHLGSDHAGVGAEGLLHHQMDGIRVGGHVVVAEQEMRCTLDHGQHLVGRRRKPLVGVEPAHIGAREGGSHARRRILGAGGVEHQHGQVRVVLSAERLQRLVEPRSGIACHHHRDDRRGCRRLHQGNEATVGGAPTPGRSPPRSPDGCLL